jgi:hypothetical protein
MLKVPEYRIFAHYGKTGYLTRTRSVIPLAREQIACRMDDSVLHIRTFWYEHHAALSDLIAEIPRPSETTATNL